MRSPGASADLENSVVPREQRADEPELRHGLRQLPGRATLESTSAPTCDSVAGRPAGVDPQLGPLAVNGSDNGTLTHAILAREQPGGGIRQELPDARWRPARGQPLAVRQTCDSGAYEFDGNTTADVPDCSPTGVIPLALDSAPGGTVVGLSYKVSGGPELQEQTPATAGSR